MNWNYELSAISDSTKNSKVSCNITGEWAVENGECIQSVFDQPRILGVDADGNINSKAYWIPFHKDITVGWKICVTGDSYADFHYILFEIHDQSDVSMRMDFMDNRHDYFGFWRAYHTQTGEYFNSTRFGTPQPLAPMNNLNINVTLVAFTQYMIEVSPINYSVLSPVHNERYLGNFTKRIIIQSESFKVNVVDLDCKWIVRGLKTLIEIFYFFQFWQWTFEQIINLRLFLLFKNLLKSRVEKRCQ